MNSTVENAIYKLAEVYADKLNKQVLQRVEDMQQDDKSHYLIYQVLKVTLEEGEMIDIYQNKGRFLYKYAGSFLEEAAILCFEHKFGEDALKKVRVPNTIGQRPKTFEIDCLVGENGKVVIGKEKKGVPLSDVWNIPYLNPKATLR